MCFLFTRALATGKISETEVTEAGRNSKRQTLAFHTAVFVVALCYCLVRGIKVNKEGLENNWKKFESGGFELVVEGFGFSYVFNCYTQYGNVSGVIRVFLSVEFGSLCFIVVYCCCQFLQVMDLAPSLQPHFIANCPVCIKTLLLKIGVLQIVLF